MVWGVSKGAAEEQSWQQWSTAVRQDDSRKADFTRLLATRLRNRGTCPAERQSRNQRYAVSVDKQAEYHSAADRQFAPRNRRGCEGLTVFVVRSR